MINVEEVILDTDMIAPEPYTVERSVGEFVSGGFQSNVSTFQVFGPVQQASNKEIQMLPEADRVGSIRSFWSPVPIFLTRGTAAVPGTQGAVPVGTLPGNTFTLPTAPPVSGNFYINGLLQIPGVDYIIDGAVITTVVPLPAKAVLWFTWPITANVQPAASDIIIWPPGGERFRVLQRYFDPGSGYWKALGTRMNAA